jgi:hypothetical protein
MREKNFWTEKEVFKPVCNQKNVNYVPLSHNHFWTIDLGDEYKHISHFFKSFSVDYLNKKITLEIYEVINSDTWNWLYWLCEVRDNSNERYMTHNVFGNNVELLASTKYKHLKAIEHNIVYDYTQKEGIAVNKIVLQYEEKERVFSK